MKTAEQGTDLHSKLSQLETQESIVQGQCGDLFRLAEGFDYRVQELEENETQIAIVIQQHLQMVSDLPSWR